MRPDAAAPFQRLDWCWFTLSEAWGVGQPGARCEWFVFTCIQPGGLLIWVEPRQYDTSNRDEQQDRFVGVNNDTLRHTYYGVAQSR